MNKSKKFVDYIGRFFDVDNIALEMIKNLVDYAELEIEFEPKKIRVLQNILCNTQLGITKQEVADLIQK